MDFPLSVQTVQGADGCTLRRLPFAYHDEWKKVLWNGRTLPVSETQYALLRVFFDHLLAHPLCLAPTPEERFAWAILAVVTERSLQREADIPNLLLLRKHVSNLNQRLLSFEIQVVALRSLQTSPLLLMLYHEHEGHKRTSTPSR